MPEKITRQQLIHIAITLVVFLAALIFALNSPLMAAKKYHERNLAIEYLLDNLYFLPAQDREPIMQQYNITESNLRDYQRGEPSPMLDRNPAVKWLLGIR